MPRQVRIEYPGAVYHAIARGDRKEPIVADDEDRIRFKALLEELAERTGWEFFCWVLMTNHYHLVFKTPEPNLVTGMQWIQNTWTKRFNARHQLTGHLFGGRYKAVLVEENDHLATLIDYVHLNPFRAGLVELRSGLESYQWSSLPDYIRPPRSRSKWLVAARGLAQRRVGPDTAATRRRYLEHLEGIARRQRGRPNLPGEDEHTLHSTLRRGWYFGSEEFRESLLQRLKEAKGKHGAEHLPTSGYTGKQAQDHGEAAAGRILELGLKLAELNEDVLPSLLKSDWRKRSIGRVIRRHTTVRATWIATALHMGNPVRTAALTAHDPSKEWGPNWRKARKLMKELSSKYGNID